MDKRELISAFAFLEVEDAVTVQDTQAILFLVSHGTGRYTPGVAVTEKNFRSLDFSKYSIPQ